MRITTARGIVELRPGAVLVCPYFEHDTLEDVSEVTRLGGEHLAAMLERGEVRSKLYELALLPASRQTPGLLLVGGDGRAGFDAYYLMHVMAAASRYLTERGYREIACLDRGTTTVFEFGQAVSEGAIRGSYSGALKKTVRNLRRSLEGVTFISGRAGAADLADGARIGQIVGEASSAARDLVNMPANELTPSTFADRAVQLANEYGLQSEILDESAMRERGMGSLLGVAAGSQQPPRLIILRYGDQNAPVRLALVGKGLTFDSGGLSLKTADGMETMKADMGGGAAVVAGMTAIARLQPQNIAVNGFVGATENMPSGTAMRPGDVLTAMNGETIEVLNTDAEGRLVLADVLAFAAQSGATHIVDFATLTGGAVVALGHIATLATGRPADWVARTVEAAAAGMERAWQMPLFREYRRAMDSEIADIKNSGGRWGSPLTAAAFLSDFVKDVPWAHMDIAGTSWADVATPYAPEGGTGAGVGTIVALVRAMSRES